MVSKLLIFNPLTECINDGLAKDRDIERHNITNAEGRSENPRPLRSIARDNSIFKKELKNRIGISDNTFTKLLQKKAEIHKIKIY